MESWNKGKYIDSLATEAFASEQEYVDYIFVWLIYANFGVLLPVEKLLVTA